MFISDFLKKMDQAINFLFEVIIILLFSVILLAVLFQVISRETGIPNTWSEELSRWAFVYLSFIGISYLVKRKSHINLDLVTIVPGLKRISLKLVFPISILSFAFYLILFYSGVELISRFGGLPSASLGITKRVLFMSIPVSFLLMSIFELTRIISLITLYIRKK